MELNDIITNIQKEFDYQDQKYTDNENKSMEVWLLIAEQYMRDSVERYAHGTQTEAKEKLLKSITCGIRALIKE